MQKCWIEYSCTAIEKHHFYTTAHGGIQSNGERHSKCCGKHYFPALSVGNSDKFVLQYLLPYHLTYLFIAAAHLCVRITRLQPMVGAMSSFVLDERDTRTELLHSPTGFPRAVAKSVFDRRVQFNLNITIIIDMTSHTFVAAMFVPFVHGTLVQSY